MKTPTTTDRKPRAARPASAPVTEPASSPLADASAETAAGQRYVASLDALVIDAATNARVGVLADALAWTVARIVVGCGVGAAGDILRNIGRYVCEMSARQEAEAEAESARKEGRAAH